MERSGEGGRDRERERRESTICVLPFAVLRLVPLQDSSSKKIIIRGCSLAFDLFNYQSNGTIV